MNANQIAVQLKTSDALTNALVTDIEVFDSHAVTTKSICYNLIGPETIRYLCLGMHAVNTCQLNRS